VLKLEGLSKRLDNFSMQNVCFDVAEGDYFVVLGASGVGKTVLLETIAGLIRPDAGSIALDGRDITAERIQRRSISLVYQDQALFPHLSVFENIAYGLRSRGVSGADLRARVTALAEQVGAASFLDRAPATLSGGEAQRVALARALATEPRCLLLDEPISALDSSARGRMRELLRKLNRNGQTVLHVTHDYEEAVSLASRVAVMEDGRISQVGTPGEIFHHPRSEFVARFVGIRNFYPGRLEAPEESNSAGRFVTNGATFYVLADARTGPGNLIIRSEDVTVSLSAQESSARNAFEGTVTDVAPARLGVEVTVDIGVEIAALVTAASVDKLSLECGRQVCVSFKASAARFVEG
jgi:molybdate/tungstate transport system ATP-binding protein